jgi:hypothetical protein
VVIFARPNFWRERDGRGTGHNGDYCCLGGADNIFNLVNDLLVCRKPGFAGDSIMAYT